MKNAVRLAVLLAALFAIGQSYAAPVSSPCTQSAIGASRCDPVNSSNPLPAVLGAGSAVIGAVSQTKSVCVTPTVTATNSYGTNYVVGGLLTFANAFNATGTGTLQSVVVTIKAVETSGFTFFPFNANPSNTTWTDAAVAAINAADVAKVRNPVSLGQNSQLAASGFTVASAVGLGAAMAPGTTSLYGVLIANGALTTQFAAATDVQVCVKTYADP